MKNLLAALIALSASMPAFAEDLKTVSACMRAHDLSRSRDDNSEFGAMSAKKNGAWYEWIVTDQRAFALEIPLNDSGYGNVYYAVPGARKGHEMMADFFLLENGNLRLTSTAYGSQKLALSPVKNATPAEIVAQLGNKLEAMAAERGAEGERVLKELNDYLADPSQDGPEGKTVAEIFEERRDYAASELRELRSCDNIKNEKVAAATKASREQIAKEIAVVDKLKK